jgi:cell division protein FtsB
VKFDRTSTRLGVALLVVSAIFFAANFADKAWTSYQVAGQRQDRIAQIAKVTAQIQQMKTDLVSLKSSDYYLQAARHYGYVRPGDIQIEVTNMPGPTSTGPAGSAVASVAHPPDKSQSVLRRVLEAIAPGL